MVDSVHHPWTVGGVGPRWTIDRASTVADRCLVQQSLRATAACCEGGNAKRETQCDRGTAHRILDSGDEEAHWRWSFGS
jgi:hypothetical protein